MSCCIVSWAVSVMTLRQQRSEWDCILLQPIIICDSDGHSVRSQRSRDGSCDSLVSAHSGRRSLLNIPAHCNASDGRTRALIGTIIKFPDQTDCDPAPVLTPVCFLKRLRCVPVSRHDCDIFCRK